MRTGSTTLLSGISQRSGEVGVEVEDSAAEGEAAVGNVDIQVEVDAVGLHLGIAGRVHIEVEVSDHPVERLAFVVVDDQRDFELAVVRAVGRRIELQAAGGDDEVHPVAGEGGFEIGVVSGWLCGWRLSACLQRCGIARFCGAGLGCDGLHSQGYRNLGGVGHARAHEGMEWIAGGLGRVRLGLFGVGGVVAAAVGELVAGVFAWASLTWILRYFPSAAVLVGV